MQCTCTDMNKSLVGLFTHVPSMTSEKKTVGLWTGYRIVMSVNKIKLQSQGCSSSSTPWIKTYPATRKSFSKLTRATQQQQAIFAWKSIVSIQSHFDTNSRSTNAKKVVRFKCSLRVSNKNILSEIILFILTPTSSIQNNKNILGAYSLLFSQGCETLYTSPEYTCIEMSCIKWPVTLITYMYLF